MAGRTGSRSNRWQLRASRVIYLPNGIELGEFSAAKSTAPPFKRCDWEVVIGTVAPLRPDKILGRLLAAFAQIDAQPARLVIAGSGSEQPVFETFADALG